MLHDEASMCTGWFLYFFTASTLHLIQGETMNELAISLIKEGEGCRLLPYQDTEGILTIGWGRNLSEGISQEEANLLLLNDYNQALNDARSAVDTFDSLSLVRQAALISMMYNLGLPRFMSFKKMLAALKLQDYQEAALQMLDSRWAQQVGRRATKLATIMKHGMMI